MNKHIEINHDSWNFFIIAFYDHLDKLNINPIRVDNFNIVISKQDFKLLCRQPEFEYLPSAATGNRYFLKSLDSLIIRAGSLNALSRIIFEQELNNLEIEYIKYLTYYLITKNHYNLLRLTSVFRYENCQPNDFTDSHETVKVYAK